jgi:hypothetical protein
MRIQKFIRFGGKALLLAGILTLCGGWDWQSFSRSRVWKQAALILSKTLIGA